MIKLTKDNTGKAIEKCKQLRPKVRFVTERVFTVQSANNNNAYTVRFDVQNGAKLAQCECKASLKNLVCYHIAGAALVNIIRQSMKRQTA
jgi:hypothetical protein